MTEVGAWRAIRLLTVLRLRRLGNLMLNIRFKPKQGANAVSRPATPGKRRLGAVLSVVMVVLMLFSFTQMSRTALMNIQCHMAPGSSCQAAAEKAKNPYAGQSAAASEISEHGVAPPVARTLALQAALLLVVAVAIPLAGARIATEDWDLEWLVTLPVSRRALLLARIAERTIVNPTGWIALLSPALVMAWYGGWRWGAPFVALAAVLALQTLAAVLRTIVDTGMRLALSADRLRNLLAVLSIANLPFLYGAMAFGMPAAPPAIWDAVQSVPGWIMWTPPGLAVTALMASNSAAALTAWGLLFAESAACIAAGVFLIAWQLRAGVVASGAREGVRKRARAASSTPASPSLLARLAPRSPIQRRELRLLGRDRQFLVQCVVMPAVMLGSQLLLNSGVNHFMDGIAANGPLLAMLSFILAGHMLMLSAFQTLNNEGKALWMLYTFPHAIEDILRDKARLWMALSLFYPMLIGGFALAHDPSPSWQGVLLAAAVAAAVLIFSRIAVALGVFACDPLSTDVRTRVRPSYAYLYLSLAGMVSYALHSEDWWQIATFLILTAGLSQALWQKARDALPFLLDPVAAPPARVSTADGLIAALAFLFVQVLAFLFATHVLKMGMGAAVTVAFATGGAVVYALARLIFWRTRTAGVPRLLPEHGGVARSVVLGPVLGIAAAALAFGYMAVLPSLPWMPKPPAQGALQGMGLPLALALAAVAAPVFEEFIFRGLVFGGLRRSMGLLPAMALSAGLFAIVHPHIGALPVFVLGLVTAWAYDKTRGLLAPMLVHATYNAAIVLVPLLLK